MSLLDVFLEIEIPKTENLKLFNATALSDFPFAKIGVNYLGFPVILISSKFDQTHLSQKNIKLKYIELTHNLECKVSENGKSKIDNFSVIVFKNNEETLQNYFLGIALSLLNSISKKPTQREVFETFKNFVEIFRSLTETPTKTIQGLWAELILIEQSKNPETLINYWHNIPEEKFDFNADSEKIEVKSSSNLERVHIFTAEQLNPPINCQVIIASIFTKQVSNGLTILDLLDKIEKRLTDIELREKIFRIVSKTLGNNFEQTAKIKYDYEIAKNSLRFYQHQDIAKVEKINIPNKVSEVKFKSDLTLVKSTDLTKLLVSGQLYKGI
ncbi:PD-(D/E)XK motif protein [Chryseobacterium cucumeris]|uniref:PD-(D/E)XK motif protein n=1 Tax=Chryseobacterium cucumeris TaxID=1813611 RepID=UPI002454F264|nr:PD-(D/E)XK motif protein [Chryseobacterium cucumeris]MDH5034009.1 PD-(D/E)XK motif protein [Chryseobacterium cucumeris]